MSEKLLQAIAIGSLVWIVAFSVSSGALHSAQNSNAPAADSFLRVDGAGLVDQFRSGGRINIGLVETADGLVVSWVSPNETAYLISLEDANQRFRFEVGDKIVSIDGTLIATSQHLWKTLESANSDTRIVVNDSRTGRATTFGVQPREVRIPVLQNESPRQPPGAKLHFVHVVDTEDPKIEGQISKNIPLWNLSPRNGLQ